MHSVWTLLASFTFHQDTVKEPRLRTAALLCYFAGQVGLAASAWGAMPVSIATAAIGSVENLRDLDSPPKKGKQKRS
jgi:hypothetical protein